MLIAAMDRRKQDEPGSLRDNDGAVRPNDAYAVTYPDEDAAGRRSTEAKTVRVAAAVICDSISEKKRIFAAARGHGEYKGKWEFPGGKVEAGETSAQALAREIREELAAGIRVGDLIATVEYDYPGFHLSMDCFWCEVVDGELKLLEAEACRWLSKDELGSVEWLPADETIIGIVGRQMG